MSLGAIHRAKSCDLDGIHCSAVGSTRTLFYSVLHIFQKCAILYLTIQCADHKQKGRSGSCPEKIMKKNEIILFESGDHAVSLPVNTDGETVWLNRNQLALLFDRDVKTIGKHINNALNEELSEDNSVVAKFATTAADGKTYQVDYYNIHTFILHLIKWSIIHAVC